VLFDDNGVRVYSMSDIFQPVTSRLLVSEACQWIEDQVRS
jgi:hypothetical protein